MAGRFSSIRSKRNIIGVFRHSGRISVFIATETWLVPVEGWFVDRFGPRIVVAFGGIIVSVAWTLNSFANSLVLLYVAAAIGGLGAGAVYGTCIGNALKWFPDRRGLAAGLTAAGFGAGAAATVIPIRTVIIGYGYEAAFLWFGLAQGLDHSGFVSGFTRAAAGRNAKTGSTAHAITA